MATEAAMVRDILCVKFIMGASSSEHQEEGTRGDMTENGMLEFSRWEAARRQRQIRLQQAA